MSESSKYVSVHARVCTTEEAEFTPSLKRLCALSSFRKLEARLRAERRSSSRPTTPSERLWVRLGFRLTDRLRLDDR